VDDDEPELDDDPDDDRSAMNCACGTCCNACGHEPNCTSNQTTEDDE
jgi:hypothetical protein